MEETMKLNPGMRFLARWFVGIFMRRGFCTPFKVVSRINTSGSVPDQPRDIFTGILLFRLICYFTQLDLEILRNSTAWWGLPGSFRSVGPLQFVSRRIDVISHGSMISA